jgi:hypothetical protein
MVESRFKFCQADCNQTQQLTLEPYHRFGQGKPPKNNFFHNFRRLEDLLSGKSVNADMN